MRPGCESDNHSTKINKTQNYYFYYYQRYVKT